MSCGNTGHDAQKEEILLNLIQRERSLRMLCPLVLSSLLSEWMNERLFGSEMSHRLCERVRIGGDCSESVFVCTCALLRFELTARVGACIDSTLCSYEHGCNCEEENDKDEAGNRQREQQMGNRRSW